MRVKFCLHTNLESGRVRWWVRDWLQYGGDVFELADNLEALPQAVLDKYPQLTIGQLQIAEQFEGAEFDDDFDKIKIKYVVQEGSDLHTWWHDSFPDNPVDPSTSKDSLDYAQMSRDVAAWFDCPESDIEFEEDEEVSEEPTSATTFLV